MTLTGAAETTGGAAVVMAMTGVVVTGVTVVVTTIAAVDTGKEMGIVVTGSWDIAIRGIPPAVVTTGVVVVVAAGRVAGSGHMKLAILYSAERNLLAQSTSAEKRVFLPSTSFL